MAADALAVLVLLSVVGGAAGVAAGLFGIGGGLLMIPALVWSLPWLGASPAQVMHLAIGTSLATMFVGAATATRAHHRRGAVDWRAWRRFAPWLAVGAALGALAGRQLAGGVLALGFAAMTVALAGWFLRGAPPPARRPADGALAAAYAAIGALGALVGVGGGILSVPLLVARGEPLPRAVGTTSALTLAVSSVGGAFYASAGPSGVTGASGLVVWPAAGALALGAFLTARLGVALAHRWPVERLRFSFAVLLVAAASSVLFR
jgi:hypothetical protein